MTMWATMTAAQSGLPFFYGVKIEIPSCYDNSSRRPDYCHASCDSNQLFPDVRTAVAAGIVMRVFA